MKNIFNLISFRLTLIALLIAFSPTWWSTSEWLSDFAYRTNNDLGIYAFAGLVVLAFSIKYF